MIVAIAGTAAGRQHCALAANLAVLRTRSGSRMCLLDIDPARSAYRWGCARKEAGQGPAMASLALPARVPSGGIDQIAARYSDLLIHTGACASQDCHSALLSARVVVVPLAPADYDLDANYGLIADLNGARMFNPSLRVLFVILADGGEPTALELARARLYVSQVMSASLATTVLHCPGAEEYGHGRCVCDAETCDPGAAAELHALYREVYAQQAAGFPISFNH
ncbi:hypothetical protein [Massilia sp. DWR3-1-1]|uniref:hypothetical protein n=1 Tax=Massilia sp. DWR3-1-1 TaxID=2804559 RepID=UPI003CF76491